MWEAGGGRSQLPCQGLGWSWALDEAPPLWPGGGVGWGVQGVWFLWVTAILFPSLLWPASNFLKEILLRVLTRDSDKSRMLFPVSVVGVLYPQRGGVGWKFSSHWVGDGISSFPGSSEKCRRWRLSFLEEIVEELAICFENKALPFQCCSDWCFQNVKILDGGGGKKTEIQAPSLYFLNIRFKSKRKSSFLAFLCLDLEGQGDSICLGLVSYLLTVQYLEKS